ncbi:MAG: hypothetical protein E6K56_07305 [Ignavibacteria bacterium]|nr:MAG: hypothetical protein E6K56_07305 [Ignavibacteria bacterium]
MPDPSDPTSHERYLFWELLSHRNNTRRPSGEILWSVGLVPEMYGLKKIRFSGRTVPALSPAGSREAGPKTQQAIALT